MKFQQMKKIIVLLLCSLNSLIYAHSNHNGNTVLRHWQLTVENKTIDGSFYMLKNGELYIEDATDNIVHFPLAGFSKEDQTFAIQKAEFIKTINAKIQTLNNSQVKQTSAFDFKFWLIISSLIVLIITTHYFSREKKNKYVLPILLMGTVSVLYSFTKTIKPQVQVATSVGLMDSTFAPFKPNVHTYYTSTYFYVESKGIPTTHGMMLGISSTGWQQQVPIPQCYIGTNAWPIPRTPTIAVTPVAVGPSHFTRGAIAVAANGIAIFNPYTNTGVDAFLDGQLDNYGGHCGRADDYHYHTAPLHLYGTTTPTLPIAFALDGFAVYGSVEPSGVAMLTLDANHGHYFNGVYHYHGSAGAPYMIANMVGQVTEDNTFQIVPQAQASPIRPGQNPLSGALITSCLPNGTSNGYILKYTKTAQTYTVDYSWTSLGVYTFNFSSSATTPTTSVYNGFVQCSVPTAINENSMDANSIIIYPNPSSDILNLKLTNTIEEKDVKEILIYDVKGDLVYKTQGYKQNIDIKKLAQGIYSIKIRLDKSQLVKKISIQ
jgi:hypothetical protein